MTWLHYFILVLITLLVYYSVVLLIYFKQEVKQQLDKIFKHVNREAFDLDALSNNEAQSEYSFDETDFPFLHDVNEVLQQAATKKFSIEEIIFSIQITMAKYPIERLSQNKEAINHYIKTETQKHCSIYLNEEKLRQLWTR